MKKNLKRLIIAMLLGVMVTTIYSIFQPKTALSQASCGSAFECYEKAIAELQEAREEIIAAENKLKNDYESLNNQISQLQNDLENKNTNINNKLQGEVDSLRNEIQSLKNNIENGTIIAQKAVMVQARDVNHWFRFHYVDSPQGNHDVFSLWKTDGVWFDDLIKVHNASRLDVDNGSGMGLTIQNGLYVFTISPTEVIHLGPGGLCYYNGNEQAWCAAR